MTSTWLEEYLILPKTRIERLDKLFRRWLYYRETYLAIHAAMLARGWTFDDAWELLPQTQQATLAAADPQNGQTFDERWGTEWLPHDQNDSEWDTTIYHEWEVDMNGQTFEVSWHLKTHIPGPAPGQVSIDLPTAASCRVLIRMFQLACAMTIEQCLCLDNRGRPVEVDE